ncbi:phosphatase PAP2 family protein [Candidatus Pacearchaeota archaeon]|nr:phosphatase PAP2 family protein [Candidatus Pacearchaeota archaeon]MBD3282685.1 phosphatase PAP2 family protein [Candidatus Pacearchaeota archaeon]
MSFNFMMSFKIITNKIFEEITFLGGILFYALFSFYFLILGEIKQFSGLILALIFIYSITFFIRLVYYKSRPKKVPYKNLIEKIDSSSFPSLHAARSTLIVLFLIFAIKLSLIFVLLISVPWLLVLYSRIYLKKHYIVDIFGGIILGVLGLILSFLIIWGM